MPRRIARHRSHDPETVEIARAAKELYPDETGHPRRMASLVAAGSDAGCRYMDIVVKGQGEDAFLEIVRRIEAGESMKGVDGAGYKEDGKSCSTRLAH